MGIKEFYILMGIVRLCLPTASHTSNYQQAKSFFIYIRILFILKYPTFAAVLQDDIFAKINFDSPADKESIEVINMTEHLASPYVQETCANRTVCDFTVDNNEICTLRIHDDDGRVEQRKFRNWCYLFLSNMCDNPGKEFYIHFPYSCSKIMQYRRMNVNSNRTKNTDGEKPRKNTTNVWTTGHSSSGNVTISSNTTHFFNANKTLKSVQRQGADKQNMFYVTKKRKYNTDLAWDYHTCQLSCPPAYKPVCLNVNKGLGKRMRFYTFVNHCEMDSYVCSHPKGDGITHINKQIKEFNLSDDQDGDQLQPSELGWTFCSSTRYTQFARFSETVHSMGHFGWLAGNFGPAHILEPWERIPGYGKK